MTQEDSDVKRERQRVESQQHHPFSYPNVQKPDLLRIKNLSKAFVNGNQTKLAVNNVSVGIKYGEVISFETSLIYLVWDKWIHFEIVIFVQFPFFLNRIVL